MNKLNKLFIFFVTIISVLSISSCVKKIPSTLTLITVNDFHGAFEEESGKYGIVRLAGAIEAEVNNAEASIVISAGDMFQGTALSNYNYGKTTIEIMNEIGFDVMTLGNHEFDWGYDKMENYQDGDKSNGEAVFPFLGCNIIEKTTGKLPEGTDAYHIVEESGLRIGIIGYMGENNESDIAESMIADYEFVDPMPIIKELTSELRNEKDVDIVITVGHEGNDLNKQLSRLTGDERIDAIVNSHTHATYSGTLTRPDGVKVPYVQAGSAGEKYGVVNLNIDIETKTVTGGTAEVKYNVGDYSHKKVDSILDDLIEETAPVFARVLGVATVKVNRNSGAYWAATALNDYAGTDIGVINYGGIRSQAFPINVGESITVSRIHEIMPFDNFLKTVDLKGSAIRILVNRSDFILSTNVFVNNATGQIYINGELLDDNKVYSVAAIDYIFDKPENPFLSGDNIVNDGTLFRDILIQRVEQDKTIKL